MERQSYELLRWGAPTGVENPQKEGKSAWPPQPRPLSQSFILGLALGCRVVFAAPSATHTIRSVFQGMGLASTLWPIAFAAVLGSLARTVALYKAEKGTNLGTLGVLLGSQTLMSTLINAFTLRILSLWVILLFILWALSPLGGQAVLRAVRVTSDAEARDYDLMYSPTADMGIPYDNILWSSNSGLVSLTSTIVPMFGAALCAPNALGQAANGSSELFDESMRQIGGTGTASLLARTDLWGNVRVPQLTSLPGYSSSKPHKWVDVPTDQLVTYESLIGIPLRGLPFGSPGNLTLRLSASYVTLECSPWFNTTEWLRTTPGVLKNHQLEDISTVMKQNGTIDMAQVYIDTPNPMGGFNFSANNITSRGPITRGTLVFGTTHNSTVCDISHAYVDVDIACERVSGLDRMACRANRVRHSPSRPLSKPDDQLIPAFGHGPAKFLAGIPLLAPSSRPGLKSPMESYLADPAKGIGRSVDAGSDYITDDYTKLPLPVFAERLAIVINTALRVSWSAYAVLNFEAVDVTQEADLYGNTTGQFASTTKVYGTQKAWMATSIVSLAVMFLASILTVGLRLMIRAPDFLTHVAALTRDSKYMDVAPGGSTLSGDERARLLKNLPLKIMDIEPDDAIGLLALFGERVTMQFISQAMGWADHIILAMAPLGIITTIVGAIRVGGPSWLKAVIGRARESRAIPEAELMSSTSNEVCELWNGHEIVRVMGKGRILEFLILLPSSKDEDIGHDSEPQDLTTQKGSGSIYTVKALELGKPMFRESLLGTCCTPPEDPEQPGHPDDNAIIIIRNKTVETPNLILNVHNYFDRREHYLAATWGIILQMGVLLYFGFTTYYPSLSLLKDGSHIQSYAFPCTAAGMLCLVAGMMLCSHVVDTSTKETRYQPHQGRDARLVWIQQYGTVNDQAFDSFALFPTDVRQMITTSRRIDANKQTKTVIATTICLGGFIVQFVGLRGMHWSAPVVQLGATIAMTVVRAWVRRNLAQLPTTRHLVAGYELDWLTLTLSMEPKKAPWSGGPGDKPDDPEKLKRPWAQNGWDWEISGVQDPAMCPALKRDSSTVNERAPLESSRTHNCRQRAHDRKGRGAAVRCGTTRQNSLQKKDRLNATDRVNKANKVLQIRRELGRIADWPGVASAEAVCLARAIEITMDALDPLFELSGHLQKTSWSMRVRGELIHFHLERTPSGSWKALADELEAALSLWLYYTEGEIERSEHKHSGEEEISIADKDDDGWLRAKGMLKRPALRLLGVSSPALQRDVEWWLPDGAARVIKVSHVKSTLNRSTSTNDLVKVERHRIVGFMPGYNGRSPLRKVPLPPWQSNNSRKGTLAEESYTPLPRLFSLHMFSTFMWAAAKSLRQPVPGEVELQPLRANDSDSTWKSFALQNTQLSRMAQDIHNTELGTLEEVYLSIVPPLSATNKLPEPDAIIYWAKKHAQRHEQLGHWEEAADAYIWLFDMSESFPKGGTFIAKTTALLMRYLDAVATALKQAKGQLFEGKSIRTLAELREKLVSQLETVDQRMILQLQRLSRTQWRDWNVHLALKAKRLKTPNQALQFTILHLLASKGCSSRELSDARERDNDINIRDILEWTPLHYAASHGDLLTLKALLEFRPDLNVQDIRGQTPLHIVCWHESGAELARVLLREGSNINMRDIDGRTPLHHAAERGHMTIALSLIEAGADVNIADGQGNTPLFWAAYKGHHELIRDLWSDAHKRLRNHNGRTPLHLAAMWSICDENPEKPKLERLGRKKARVVRALRQYEPDKEARDAFNQTPLHSAAGSGNRYVAQALLDLGADMEAETRDGDTPLSVAAEYGHQTTVELLLNRGANIDGGQGPARKIPLHAAARAGHTYVVRLLLGKGAHINNFNAQVKNVLHYAAEGGHETMTRLLLKKGAYKEFKDSDGDRPVHCAAKHGQEAVLRVLLERKADINALGQFGTVLSVAAKQGSMSIVALLLKNDACTEVEEEQDERPLYLASKCGHYGVTEILLNAGALIGGGPTGKHGHNSTPLHAAALNNHLKIARLLLQRGADKHALDAQGRTPLCVAAEKGNSSMAQLLLEEGSRADTMEGDQESPLHIAARDARYKTLQLILDRGANIEAKARFGWTPLHHAAFWGHESIVRLLLDRGSEINPRDRDYQTPLFLAIQVHSKAVVQLLLDRGADKKAQNKEGMRPVDWAERWEYNDLVQLLRD
ncbi:hypothetical protein FDECE_897 [Fusarium decemcellulare]|nr:hypothetical protein FDECE_897 [Fusarium decemcellulare]